MMDAVVGWQVKKGRLAAVARIMVRREGTTMRGEGWKASSLQKSLSAIFGVLPSLSLSLSLCIGLVSLSLLLYIHSLV